MTASCTELYERSSGCGELTKTFIAPSASRSSTAPPRFPLTTLNWALLPASDLKAWLKMLHGLSRMVRSGRQLSGRKRNTMTCLTCTGSFVSFHARWSVSRLPISKSPRPPAGVTNANPHTHRAAHSALTVLNYSDHPHNVRLMFLAEVIMEAFTSDRTPRLQPAPAERLVQKQRHINTGCVSWVQENIWWSWEELLSAPGLKGYRAWRSSHRKGMRLWRISPSEPDWAVALFPNKNRRS